MGNPGWAYRGAYFFSKKNSGGDVSEMFFREKKRELRLFSKKKESEDLFLQDLKSQEGQKVAFVGPSDSGVFIGVWKRVSFSNNVLETYWKLSCALIQFVSTKMLGGNMRTIYHQVWQGFGSINFKIWLGTHCRLRCRWFRMRYQQQVTCTWYVSSSVCSLLDSCWSLWVEVAGWNGLNTISLRNYHSLTRTLLHCLWKWKMFSTLEKWDGL